MNYSHELVMPNQDLPFKMFLFEGQLGNYIREKHWHRSIEIFAVFEGSLEFFMNGKYLLLEKEEFVIVNSNEVHSIKTLSPNRTVVLQIPLKMFEHYYTEDQFIRFEHKNQEKDKYFMEMISRMFLLYEEKDDGYELRVQSLFYELMFLLVTTYRKTEVSDEIIRANKQLSKLSVIANYIKEHYDQELSLEGVAKRYGYSPTYLSRMFHKYAHTNYKTYLQNIRLEYAYQELMNTERQIGDIAEKCGFADGRAFSKAFKRKYGCLPSEYKKAKKCS